MNRFYTFGFILGIYFGVYFIILILRRKTGISECKYDERQTAIQGTAYKYATITGVIAGCLASFLVEDEVLPVSGGFAMIVISLLMAAVYAICMILKGVYFGITGSWKKWTALILLVGVCNLFFGVSHIMDEGLPEGRFTIVNVNLPLGILFLIIVAAVFFRRVRESREAD